MSLPDFGPDSIDPTLFDFSEMVEEDRLNRQREAFQVEARPVPEGITRRGPAALGHYAYKANQIDTSERATTPTPLPPSRSFVGYLALGITPDSIG